MLAGKILPPGPPPHPHFECCCMPRCTAPRPWHGTPSPLLQTHQRFSISERQGWYFSVKQASELTKWLKTAWWQQDIKKEFWDDKTIIVSANWRRINRCGQVLKKHCKTPLSGFSSLSTTASTDKYCGSEFKVDRELRAADLDVPDFLLLKLVYGLLQLPGGPRGIHSGSLELTFSLMAEQMSAWQTPQNMSDQHERLWLQLLSKASVCHKAMNTETRHYCFVFVDLISTKTDLCLKS